MKVSDYIVSFLEEKGVRIVFGYIGGMITHLVDSIATNPNIRFVQVYHEQTAAIAAEGYACGSGGIGVAISTSGPGATNMLTGIADAYFDSIPVIYITGQVNTYEYKYDKPVRQMGFQETDVVSIVTPVTKYAALVDDAANIRYELEKAYAIALEGRPGPVLLDIPMNIQRAEICVETLNSYSHPARQASFDKEQVIKAIAESHRPLLLVGGGARSEKAGKNLRDLLEKVKLPVVCSLKGKGIVDETLPEFMGMVGSYGNRAANFAVANADLLIVLGSRLDTRQTGARLDAFLREGRVIHVDIDSRELEGHRIRNKLNIQIEVSEFLGWLKDHITIRKNMASWYGYLRQLKLNYNQQREVERFVENKSPYTFMEILNNRIGSEDIFCVDVGQNQMWAAQALRIRPGGDFYTSGGLAPMGFAVPFAIGLAFSVKNKTIWAICGDGGFHISLQALLLISQYNLPVKIIVMNNESLGMITQFQELYFEGRMAGTTKEGGYCVPDVKALAQAYQLNYFCLGQENMLDEDAWSEIAGMRNCIIEFRTEGLTRVSPKLEFDKPLECLSPQLPEEEFIQNMLIAKDKK